MPFHLEKGPWIMELERFLNAGPEQAWDILQRCRADFGPLVSEYAAAPYLDGDPLYGTADDREWHLRTHWFGGGQRKGEGAQPPFGHWLAAVLHELRGAEAPAGDELDHPDVVHELLVALTTDELYAIGRWPSTGFWRQYYGDVEAIVRQTVISALEVSLGLPSGSTERDAVTRHLPLEIFWKCPQPWFEGWVTWRLHESTSDKGQVTVVLATPGTGTPVLQSPMFGRGAIESPWTVAAGRTPTDPSTYDARSASPDHLDRGMWVITHHENLVLPAIPSNRPTRRGQWEGIVPAIGPAYAGVGPIRVVSPSLQDGGVEPSHPGGGYGTAQQAAAL
jgi:hypothetical protein